MARRRRQYRIGGGGQETITDPYEEQRRKNQIAADQYSNMVRGQQETPDLAAESEPARIALATALGESKDTPLGPLMARFRSLPPDVQAGIYRAGGAQFMGGVEGSKLLSNLSSNKEEALDRQTANLGEMLASGKIQFDQDEGGKPSFYSEEVDESDPLKKKKKVPLNVYQLGLLERGFQKGTLVNPWNPTRNDTSINMPPKQTVEEFQQVLNQRALGSSDVDEFQRILNARAIAPEGVLGPKPAVDTASILMSEAPPASPPTAPLAPTAPLDPFLSANKYLRSGEFKRDVGGIVGDVGTAAIDTISAGIVNPLARLGAAGTRLLTGTDIQAPQLPLFSQQPADRPEMLEFYDEEARRQAEARRLAPMMMPMRTGY